MVETRPLADGAPDHAPYNVILINGAVETVPDALLAQLRDGGRLVAIEIHGGVGRCAVWTRSGDAIASRRAFDAAAPVLAGFARAAAFEF